MFKKDDLVIINNRVAKIRELSNDGTYYLLNYYNPDSKTFSTYNDSCDVNTDIKLIKEIPTDKEFLEMFLMKRVPCKKILLENEQKVFESDIEYDNRQIKSCELTITDLKNRIKTYEQKLEIIKKQLPKTKDTRKEQIKNMLRNIKAHPKVLDVFPYSNFLVVKTKSLKFYDIIDRKVPIFNQGAFYIFFDSSSVRVANYEKHYKSGTRHHCCVTTDGSCCLGDSINKELKKYLKEGNYDLATSMMIDFLEEPNTNNPYIRPELFVGAQKITTHPENIFNYINYSWMQENQKWDEEKYKMIIKNFAAKIGIKEREERNKKFVESKKTTSRVIRQSEPNT